MANSITTRLDALEAQMTGVMELVTELVEAVNDLEELAGVTGEGIEEPAAEPAEAPADKPAAKKGK